MNDLVECKNCGTLYHIASKDLAYFSCGTCRKKVSLKQLKAPSIKTTLRPDDRLRKFQDRLSRGVFFAASTVGVFVLLLMVPTAFFFKDSSLSLVLMIIELVLGTLLLCSAIAFYLLSLQVFSLQALMTFQQHNLAIFHDQIARLFGMFRRRD